ncbi:MAG: ATP-binding protein, partial [Candidatus Thermoplasmatota archaeon]|nr:ATP-binding protein [Candidatus Thermoplasmatota archaeon]
MDKPDEAKYFEDSVEEWSSSLDFETTAEIPIPEKLADQVIGQDEAVDVIKKAAQQKRHVLLIGDPGVGKSMLANSMVDFLPKGQLQDVLAYDNQEDPNEPKIRVVPAGKGKDIIRAEKARAAQKKQQKAQGLLIIIFLVLTLAFILAISPQDGGGFSIDPNTILFGIIAAAAVFLVMRIGSQRE